MTSTPQSQYEFSLDPEHMLSVAGNYYTSFLLHLLTIFDIILCIILLYYTLYSKDHYFEKGFCISNLSVADI